MHNSGSGRIAVALSFISDCLTPGKLGKMSLSVQHKFFVIAESKLVKKGLNLEFTAEIAPGKNKLLFPRKILMFGI